MNEKLKSKEQSRATSKYHKNKKIPNAHFVPFLPPSAAPPRSAATPFLTPHQSVSAASTSSAMGPGMLLAFRRRSDPRARDGQAISGRIPLERRRGLRVSGSDLGGSFRSRIFGGFPIPRAESFNGVELGDYLFFRGTCFWHSLSVFSVFFKIDLISDNSN